MNVVLGVLLAFSVISSCFGDGVDVDGVDMDGIDVERVDVDVEGVVITVLC